MARTDLIAAVLALADGDPALTDNSRLIILGALEGDNALDDALGGHGQTLAQAAAAPASAHPPVGAFLKSIKIAGFRGIGEALTVAFHPGPGLTVIAGRNGSGKSSIAEALEMALTGQSYRWHRQSGAVWTANWRNLHGHIPAEIRVELAEEGRGITTIGVDWSSDAGLQDGTCWVQRRGEKRQIGRESLGWDAPLDLYRPLLSYDEVGGVLEGPPSGLHDKLHSLLGLEPITDGQKRLTAALKRLQAPVADAKTALAQLKTQLSGSSDPRAASALPLLAKRSPNKDALEQLATGSAILVDGMLDRLRSIARLTWPDPAEVEAVAAELRSAVTALALQAGSASAVLADRSRLLAGALALHDSHGEMDCPVCGIGRLDPEWTERTRAALDAQRSELAGLKTSQDRMDVARRAGRQLVAGLAVLPRIEDEELTTLTAAVQARADWSNAPTDDLELADHLLAAIDPVVETFTGLRDQALSLVAAREDLWAPMALQLGNWVRLAREVEQAAPLVAEVKAASDWLKGSAGDLRNQRLAPLADRARDIWARLRQESNVDLGAIRLEGQATNRRVELSAEVDGIGAGALGVMSQGELHALALSLFLPRATAPDSPFRFIVLDDPIQAMDPAKVQGFVQVLQELAVDRQVIVLSHDDRLPAAVRRVKANARIYEVTRMAGSRVKISESSHPAARYLDDGMALALDENVPAAVKDRVIPGLCRMALESAAFEVFQDRFIGQGGDRNEVEERWGATTTLRQRLAIALAADKTADIKKWLATGRHQEAFNVCNHSVHVGSTRDHGDEVRAVRATVKDVRASL